MKRSQFVLPSLISLGWGVTIGLLTGQPMANASDITPTPAVRETVNPPAQTPSPSSSDATDKSASETIEEKILATHLILKLKERRVYAYQDGKVLASFPVAVGKKGWETPTGNFSIIQLIANPSWQNPWNGKVTPAGPKNPLGERWIGFWTDGKDFIGFHGTTAENLIGQAVSHGCVRMRNNDIKQLFEFVQMGTTVMVQP